MGQQLVAAYDPGGLYVKDAMLLLSRSEVSLKYILAIINSRLLNYYYQEFFVTIDVLKNALLALPIRLIDFANAVDKGEHDHLVDLSRPRCSLSRNPGGDFREPYPERSQSKIA